jgi:hypothetical protein
MDPRTSFAFLKGNFLQAKVQEPHGTPQYFMVINWGKTMVSSINCGKTMVSGFQMFPKAMR